MVAQSQAEAVASGAVELDDDEVEYSDFIKEDDESSQMDTNRGVHHTNIPML